MTVARRRGDERLVVQWVGEDLGAGVVEVLLADRDDAGGDAPGVLQGDADLVGDVGEPAGGDGARLGGARAEEPFGGADLLVGLTEPLDPLEVESVGNGELEVALISGSSGVA
jgi:hypothetical protein